MRMSKWCTSNEVRVAGGDRTGPANLHLKVCMDRVGWNGPEN